MTERHKFILENRPLVRHIANKLFSRINGTVPLEELVSAGDLGLCEAVDRYDSSRGVKFSAYAYRRIEGEMIVYLRELDRMTRGDRRLSQRVQKAEEICRSILGREPRVDELRQASGISSRHYKRWKSAMCAAIPMVSLSEDDEGSSIQLRSYGFSEDELLDWIDLDRAMCNLPRRSRFIVGMYYIEGLTEECIASRYKITASRVSQILRGAREQLRLELAA